MTGAKRRALHPLAWWLWALALGAAALRTSNPLLLGLLVASAWFVVAARRSEAPWARSFGSFLRLGGVIIFIRMVLQALFGTRLPGHELFRVPEAVLPDWAAGVSVGGPVTAEAMAAAFRDGLQLAALLACVGAANSLASPYRLLRSMPAVLYELGVVVTVALSFAPQAVISAQRVRDARRLRGRPHRGLAGLRGLAIPVLEGALEHSLQLAASMDSRGYGRRGEAAPRRRLVANAMTLVGALAVCAGAYGLLDASAPRLLGLPALLAGGALLGASLVLAGSTSVRTRYRPDPWRLPEWATLGAGVATLAGLVVATRVGVHGVQPAYSPVAWPALPLLPAAATLIAVVPAFVTPEPS
ncbi:MAG: energy-coupling factor transporter transmembrane component T [Acidimicrobiales bacterium]